MGITYYFASTNKNPWRKTKTILLPPSFNIAPENGWLEDQFPFGGQKAYFQELAVSFRESNSIEIVFFQLSYLIYLILSSLDRRCRGWLLFRFPKKSKGFLVWRCTPWKINVLHPQITHLERNIIFKTSMNYVPCWSSRVYDIAVSQADHSNNSPLELLIVNATKIMVLSEIKWPLDSQGYYIP